MGNSASGMLVVNQPGYKDVKSRDKKIDKIIGDIINQIKYNQFISKLLIKLNTTHIKIKINT